MIIYKKKRKRIEPRECCDCWKRVLKRSSIELTKNENCRMGFHLGASLITERQ